MNQRGVSLELARTDFEAGRWEFHIEEAYEQGREAKELARKEGFVDEGAARVIREEIEKFLKGEREKRGVVRQGAEGMEGNKWGCIGM